MFLDPLSWVWVVSSVYLVALIICVYMIYKGHW